MRNKSIALFGIASYLLSIYASQTNIEGESTAPVYILIISGIASTLFTVLATIRLWKISKFTSILFGSISAIFFLMEVLQVTFSSANGTPFILFLSSTKLINILIYFYVIFILFRIDK